MDCLSTLQVETRIGMPMKVMDAEDRTAGQHWNGPWVWVQM